MTCDQTKSKTFPDHNLTIGPDRAYVTGALQNVTYSLLNANNKHLKMPYSKFFLLEIMTHSQINMYIFSEFNPISPSQVENANRINKM